MGKSSKKAAPKVDAAPVVAAKDSKPAKKGKRGAEEVIEKVVSAKKQKLERDEAVAAKKKVEAKTVKKEEEETSSSDDSSSESDDEPPKEKPDLSNASNAQPKKKEEESESGSDSDETDSDDEKPAVKESKESSSSDESSEEETDEESEEEKPSKAPKKPLEVSNGSKSSEESSDEESESEESSGEESEEESEEEKPLKKSKKKDTDVEMIDAASPKTDSKQANKKFEKNAPKTPVTPQGQGSKTLFVGNLSFKVEQADVENFFKDAGEIVEVRFASGPDGTFKGFGHVEFATAEGAQKALELNGQELLGRPVRLDLAKERGSFTPKSGESTFRKGQTTEGNTVFVRGFDKSLEEDAVRSALQEHFGSCGEITRISVPKDFESGSVKGIAYLDFTDNNSLDQALELNGSDLGGYSLYVDRAKPKGDGGFGNRSGGRDDKFSGGRRGGRGDRGGRRGGDRGGRRGGRRGSGTPNRMNIGATPKGKKTTFGED